MDGLTETHVVGEACAHSIALQERQPTDAGALVRTEGALEAFRLLQERHLLNGIIGSEDLRNPSLGVDANHRQATIGSIKMRHAQGFDKGCLAVGVLLQELDATLQIFWADFHPATVDSHQRHALLGQRLEFLKGEWRISQRNLPTVIHQAVQADAAVRLATFATLARGRVAVDEQSCAHTISRLAPPIRREHFKASLLQHRLEVTEELICLGGLEFHTRGGAFVKAFLNLWIQATGSAKFP